MSPRKFSRTCAVAFTAFAMVAQVATAAPKVWVIGDSRSTGAVEGYTEYLPKAIGSAASCSFLRIDALIGELYPKIGTFKGAAMVHFMGGLDDLTCISLKTQAEQDKIYDAYVAEMGKVIDKMKSDLPGTVIVHATMFKVSGPGGCSQKDERCPGCRRRDSDVVKFNKGSTTVANNKKIITEDLYTFAKDIPQADGRHFDEAGQAKVAKEVAAFIVKNLPKATATTQNLNSSRHAPTSITSSPAGLRIVNTAGPNLNVKIHSLRGELVDELNLSRNEAGSSRSSGRASGAVIVAMTAGGDSWSVPVNTASTQNTKVGL